MFTFTRIDQGIVRVQHDGPISVSDSRQFRAFLKQYRGQLLIDMHATPPGDAMRELLRVRPMLPRTACIGAAEHRMVCDQLPGKDIYLSELRHFATDAEALAWLRGEDVCCDEDDEAAVAA